MKDPLLALLAGLGDDEEVIVRPFFSGLDERRNGLKFIVSRRVPGGRVEAGAWITAPELSRDEPEFLVLRAAIEAVRKAEANGDADAMRRALGDLRKSEGD